MSIGCAPLDYVFYDGAAVFYCVGIATALGAWNKLASSFYSSTVVVYLPVSSVATVDVLISVLSLFVGLPVSSAYTVVFFTVD